MAFKRLADQFSITRDSHHFVEFKTLKHPKVNDEVRLAFAVEGESKFARATVQDLIDTFEVSFFDHFELNPYERFENALREVNIIYKNIRSKRGGSALGKLSAAMAIFSGTQMHLTQCGEAEVYLVRKQRLSHVSEGLSTHGGDLFVNIASGELMPEDRVIFSTARLLRTMSQSQLVNACRGGVTEAIDAIREYMMDADDSSLGVSCIHLQVPYRNTKVVPRTSGNWMDKVQQMTQSVTDLFSGKKGGRANPMNRNTLLAALLGVILVFIVSVILLVDGRRNRLEREEYRDKIQAMDADLSTASVKGNGDEKQTANVILDEIETEARAMLETEFFNSEAMAILEEVQTLRDDINNTLRVSEPSPYVDLTEKNANASAVGLGQNEEGLVAFESGQVYDIILDRPLDPKPVNEGQRLANVTTMEDFNNIVFLTESNQMVEYNGENFDLVDTQDDAWKPGVDLAAYGKFLYILNPEENQIYKYSRGNSGYAGASNYNQNADLDAAVSLAIDGSVYVLKQGGEIIKLFKGEVADFQIEDLAVDINEANEILTTPDLNFLYVLDSVNERVVVLEKDAGLGARYRGQIQFENLDIQGIQVDRGEELLYAVTPKAIYRVSLSELDLK